MTWLLIAILYAAPDDRANIYTPATLAFHEFRNRKDCEEAGKELAALHIGKVLFRCKPSTG